MEVAAVRAVAHDCGYEEVLYGASDGICIFESPALASQINVWFQSGTVGVTVPQPRNPRHTSFHFGVTTPSALAAVFKRSNEARPTGALPTAQLLSEEGALKRQLNSLAKEADWVQQERELLQRRLNALPRSGAPAGGSSISSGADVDELEKRKRELTEEIQLLEKKRTMQSEQPREWTGGLVGGPSYDMGGSGPLDEDEGKYQSQKSVYLNRSVSSVLRETPGRLKGNRCLYSFVDEMYQEEFARSWGDRPVHTVALGRGYVIVYEDGGVAWWNIPFALEGKFRDEDLKLPPLRFVALGPEDNYFVKFVNGKMEWVAKDSFQQRLRKGVEDDGLYVNHVALGPGGSWVILWSNGLADFEGIAVDLEGVITQANDEGPAVKEVSLGPAGEWFVIFTDNSVQANNLPSGLHSALRSIKQQNGRVRSIMFGESSSWYLRYWDGKA